MDDTLRSRINHAALVHGWRLIDSRETDRLFLFDLRQKKETLTVYVRKGKTLSSSQINKMLSYHRHCDFYENNI